MNFAHIIPRIVGSYLEDYNILKVDDLIRDWFAKLPSILKNIEGEIDREKAKMNTTMSGIQYKMIRNKIKELGEILQRISGKPGLDEYEKNTRELLTRYRNLGCHTTTVIFDLGAEIIKNNIDPVRIDTIQKYLDIASKFVGVDVFRVANTSPICPSCDKDMTKTESGTVCKNCNISLPDIVKPTIADSVIIGKNNYKDRDTFIKTIQRLEGKETTKIPEIIFKDLDDHFSSLGLPTGKEVREMNLSKTDINPISKKMLARGLRAKGHSHYYENINLIGHIYLGWQLPDYTGLYDRLMKDYDDTQIIYEQLRNEGFVEGTSSINSQVRALAHLRHLGVECDLDDFKLSENRDTLGGYDRTLEEMFRRMGWHYTRIT